MCSSAGGLGWRKLGERREEKKILYGRQLAMLDEERLVMVVADKLRMDGGRMVGRIGTR